MVDRRTWRQVEPRKVWPFAWVPLAGRLELAPDRVHLDAEHSSGAALEVVAEVVAGVVWPVAFHVTARDGARLRHRELRAWADGVEELARFAVVQSAVWSTDPVRYLDAAERADLDRHLARGRRPRSRPDDLEARHVAVLEVVAAAEAAGEPAGPAIARTFGVSPGNARQIRRRALAWQQQQNGDAR